MKNKRFQIIWAVVLVNSLPPAIGDGRVESNHLVGTPDLWSRKVSKREERRRRRRMPLNIFRRCAYTNARHSHRRFVKKMLIRRKTKGIGVMLSSSFFEFLFSFASHGFDCICCVYVLRASNSQIPKIQTPHFKIKRGMGGEMRNKSLLLTAVLFQKSGFPPCKRLRKCR